MGRLLAMDKPVILATMYFVYGSNARFGVRSKTTFDAVLAGERTSTTRFPHWPGYRRWEFLRKGQIVRFFDTKEMDKRCVDVVVTHVAPINLRSCSDMGLEEWSKAEGWSPKFGRDLGIMHGPGTWIRFEPRLCEVNLSDQVTDDFKKVAHK